MGDFMMDRYTQGKVNRISPEAPVAVLKVEKEKSLPGGAGNTALNLKALGSQVKILGRVGEDAAGHDLRDFFELEHIGGSLFSEMGFCTPLKNRFIADSQQLLRVDFEEVIPSSKELEEEVIEALPSLMADVEVVAISDYGKGFLSKNILSHIFKVAKELSIPTIVDPKGVDFSKYRGATILKPNLLEAYLASKLPQSEPLKKVAEKILEETGISHLLITRSENGISLFSRDRDPIDFPVRVREVKDVTGAGDTVLATVAFAIANGLGMDKAVELANLAAGMVIERLGCARVSLNEIAKRLLEEDVENKIFEDLPPLKSVLLEEDITILNLEGAKEVTAAICRSINHLSKEKIGKLLVYVGNDKNEEMVEILAAFRGVDFIILKEASLEEITTKTVYFIKDDKLHSDGSKLLLKNLYPN